MAQKVQTLLIDDLDGVEADGTVRFGLDGTDYEIDLSAKHAEALRKALAPYLGAARRASGSVARRPGRPGRKAASVGGPDPTAVRVWAKRRASMSRTADECQPSSWSSSRRQQASREPFPILRGPRSCVKNRTGNQAEPHTLSEANSHGSSRQNGGQCPSVGSSKTSTGLIGHFALLM